MAFEEKKYLDYEGLKSYNAKIQAKIDAADTALDSAIQKVAGDLTAEVTNRENAVNAVNAKLGNIPEGKTVDKMIEDAQAAATYDDTGIKKDISDNKAAIDAINNADSGILANAKKYTDELAAKVGEVDGDKSLAEIVAENADAAKVTLTTAETATEGYLKTYVLSQGNSELGKIDIPKELVVTSGEIVTIEDEKFIKLTIANQEEPIFINVKDLVDVYTVEANAAQVQLAISDENIISATIVAKSVGTAELADAAVTTAKIADGNVTRAKIDADFEAEIQALQDAVGKGGSVETQITNAIAELDADVSSADPEAGKGVKVQVVEVDGKITAVNVTGNYDNAYEAKGAAETLAQGAVKDNADAIAEIINEETGILATANKNIDNLEKSLVVISTTEIDELFPTV